MRDRLAFYNAPPASALRRSVTRCCAASVGRRRAVHLGGGAVRASQWLQRGPPATKPQRSSPKKQNACLTMGIVPLVPNWLLMAAYAYFGYRFYRGFDRTTYDSSVRLMLTFVWPLLLATREGRRNVQRALGTSDN